MSFINTIKTWFTASPTAPQVPPLPETEPNLPEEHHAPQQEITPLPPVPDVTPPPETPALPPEMDAMGLRSETEFCGLVLEQVMLAHSTWLKNLEAALRGQNPSIYKTKLASDDRLSELGKWLYQNEKIFTAYPEYHILIEMHKRFHQCAGEVVEHHRQGHFADAILLLRRDLSLLSEEVQKSLINLHKQVQEKGGNICGWFSGCLKTKNAL